ncbi:MFS-type transporter involved in bile tolerance, Atg22 family [Halobacillus dabanensis]|uniref:MFS-type transporter involved in bile tolerance, Atg22 family n=1 Tax=Halobacillus dabanensis TaxID=240302 RepID=A0A1I3Q848_HALDA|nr:MFS transporter [Halobacillus dabanensis]SFJ30253.1 MFS-type transporter involved in bile tolerance, Atg22 family [Halobacillus dabanensis]
MKLYKELLTNKNFLLITAGRLFKRSALTLFTLELIWLTMELTSNSPLYLSIMTMAETLPFIIFGLYGGAKADKWNKKKVMVIGNSCSALLLLSIPCLNAVNLLNYYTLLMIAIAITIFSCFSEPCYRAILPELLSKTKLKEANALLDSVQRGVTIFVPASIGLLLKFFSEIHLFSLAFLLMATAVAFQLMVEYRPFNHSAEETQIKSTTFHGIKDSLSFLKGHPEITFIIAGQGLSILINTGLWRVGLPIYLEGYLNENITTFGYITGMMGVTSFITSLALGISKKYNPRVVFNVGMGLWGLGLLMIGTLPTMPIIYIATILIGVGQASEGLSRVVILQEKVPANMLGKVFSTSSSINYTSDTISLGAVSSLLGLFTIATLFSGGGTLILMIGLLGAVFGRVHKNGRRHLQTKKSG